MSDSSGIGVLLPGQGAQDVGMGRELATQDARIADLWRRADAVLGAPLSRVAWEGPAEELTRTENAQPALLVHSYTVWSALPETVRARVVVGAGHSLGEFTAYLLAGALDFDDAVRLVRRRGELMAEAGDRRPGTMAAVLGLEPAGVEASCAAASSGTAVAANFNAPGQIVISGDVAAVEEAGQAALAAGAKRVLPLNVSGAFHSPLMEEAKVELERALADVPVSDPGFPVVANATAKPVTTAAEARRLLVEQLTSPVRWVESLETMRASGIAEWLELGSGRVLSGLLKRLDRAASVAALDGPESIRTYAEAEPND
ncbi:MAG: ACP S-malonyltransferase [Gemmatimonadota bacterium]